MNERIKELAEQAGAYWNHGDFKIFKGLIAISLVLIPLGVWKFWELFFWFTDWFIDFWTTL